MVAAALPAQPATDYADLADRLGRYARTAMDQDAPGLLDLTDPALFEIIPRELLQQQYAALSSTDRIRFEVKNYVVEEIGAVVHHGDTDYAPVRCRHQLICQPVAADFDNPNTRHRLLRLLQKNFGSDNVRTDEQRGLLLAEVEKTLFAIRRGDNDWYFFEYRNDTAGLLDLVLPPAVRERVMD